MSPEKFVGVTVARILRPRGLRGEVAAAILTDFPERLPQLREAWLTDGVRPARVAKIERCWLSTARGGQAIFHFAGIDNIEQAEFLRGLEVQIPASQRTQLPPANYYVGDLVGCEVWESRTSAALGVVRDVEFPGGVPLLKVVSGDDEILVPLAAQICVEIDPQAKRIQVVLPEGLRDLNRG